MKKVTSTLILTFLFFQFSAAQINILESPRSNKPIQCSQWEVNDLVYQVKKKVENPFSRKVYAIVTGEKKVQKIPLFYNGNNDWVFRYSSASTGSKTFVLESEIKELEGKKGSFVISKNEKLDRHGGVVLNKEDPQHFYYEDGSHYFNLAFECDWLFALDYGKEDIPKTRHLLSLLDQNGFNQVVTTLFSYDVDTAWITDPRLQEYPEYNYGSPEDIFPFLGSNSKPDYSALNIDFFKHYDRIVAEMHEKEIVCHLMIYVWNKLVNWPEPGGEADNMYYDYVIKRYQAFPNMIWDVSKEAASPIAYSRNKSIIEHLEERIARTRKLDAYGRLLSVHDFGFCRNHRDQVDFISIQHWKHTLYQFMLDARNEFPDKPVFNIEHGGYEESWIEVFPGAYADAEACLRRNYLCLFAGTYTTYYWQGTSWNVIIHDPFEQPGDRYKPHFEYFRHMRNLFESVNFENCLPEPGHNSSGYNLTNRKDGIVLMYTPKESHTIHAQSLIEREFNYDNATRQWFNTLTGEFTKEEKVEYINKYRMWDWRPWRNEADAVLIIRNLEPKNE